MEIKKGNPPDGFVITLSPEEARTLIDDCEVASEALYSAPEGNQAPADRLWHMGFELRERVNE